MGDKKRRHRSVAPPFPFARPRGNPLLISDKDGVIAVVTTASRLADRHDNRIGSAPAKALSRIYIAASPAHRRKDHVMPISTLAEALSHYHAVDRVGVHMTALLVPLAVVPGP